MVKYLKPCAKTKLEKKENVPSWPSHQIDLLCYVSMYMYICILSPRRGPGNGRSRR